MKIEIEKIWKNIAKIQKSLEILKEDSTNDQSKINDIEKHLGEIRIKLEFVDKTGRR